MKTVCAWCGKTKKVTSDGNDSISHGICEVCADKAMRELKGLKEPGKKELGAR